MIASDDSIAVFCRTYARRIAAVPIVRIPTPLWLIGLIGAALLIDWPLQLPAGGTALVAGTWLMWLVPVILFALDNYVIIPFEEQSMARAFGAAYDAYRAQVRRWL